MRILFTGASSPVGSRVLRQMLRSEEYSEIWSAHHQTALNVSDPRVRVFDLDLVSDFDLRPVPGPIDLVVHIAAVTHAADTADYFRVNHRGTVRLAQSVRERDCRKFVFISTRCATTNAGAYGESKLAAEEDLKNFDWQSLLIIRPSEVYGASGNEGIDQLISLARRWHITPMLFGDARIEFAPLHIDDFAAIVARAIADLQPGSRILEICGPEDLNGRRIALALARHFNAVPIPVWWPLLDFFINAGRRVGLSFTAPDQSERLTCPKTGSATRAEVTGETRFYS